MTTTHIPTRKSSERLQEENSTLRQRLDSFLRQGKLNEEKQRRFQSFELRLIGIDSLNELLAAILFPHYLTFKWDAISLLLLDPEYEIRRILQEAGSDLADHPALKFAADRDNLEAIYPSMLFTSLGPYKPAQHGELFAGIGERAPASIALLPLLRCGKLIGSLNIGSFESKRFERGVRTDFFEHLAGVVAICIENAANIERLKRQGLSDPLTAVNNRRFFDQRLGEEIASACRDHQPLSCLLLDIDHFKQVNDQYGHQTGDEVLMTVADLIRKQLRGNDVLARYGGEEFVVLLANTGNEEAVDVAERIRQAIAAHHHQTTEGSDFSVTISGGTATLMPPNAGAGCDGEQDLATYLVGQADRVLYEAKASGRNCVVSAGEIKETGDWT